MRTKVRFDLDVTPETDEWLRKVQVAEGRMSRRNMAAVIINRVRCLSEKSPEDARRFGLVQMQA